jgi:trk system potassium uptake protein TrkH
MRKGSGSIYNRKNEPFKSRLRQTDPVLLVIYGYIIYIGFGTFLLAMPFAQSNTVNFLDSIFVSASAVSTTGLTPVDIHSDFNTFGHLVILLLIQMGGIGYMTFSSFVLLSRKQKLSDKRKNVSKTIFSIPKDFIIEKFLFRVIVFTGLIEGLGTAALFFIFRNEGVKYPLWQALFTSISAFCTAGFSLFSGNLEQFSGNFWLNFVISVLSISGAIGFIVFVDAFNYISRKTPHLSFTSRIIIRTTAYILIAGTIIILITEGSSWEGASYEKVLYSFFQTMSAMSTVGFNSVPIAPLSKSVLFLIVLFMIIGASPAGTGGGMKSTTFTSIIGQIRTVLLDKRDVTFWKQRIPADRVRQANATLGMYLASLFVGVYLLTLTEDAQLMEIFFEAASALGTVGLSMDFTSDLSALGKIWIIFLMFVGRVGPLSFGMALFVKNKLIWDNRETDLAI